MSQRIYRIGEVIGQVGLSLPTVFYYEEDGSSSRRAGERYDKLRSQVAAADRIARRVARAADRGTVRSR